jgi:hypothetical protein
MNKIKNFCLSNNILDKDSTDDFLRIKKGRKVAGVYLQKYTQKYVFIFINFKTSDITQRYYEIYCDTEDEIIKLLKNYMGYYFFIVME